MGLRRGSPAPFDAAMSRASMGPREAHRASPREKARNAERRGPLQMDQKL
ncbi:Hypothetical protein A7982_01656 [Minicystis rosea]|nr:Hypothetical protein A7982_01656 [Minicystis rosea]